MTLSADRGSVRVRQRSRTSLGAFADPLQPRFEETGIDQLQVRVKARFAAALCGGGINGYREALATADPDTNWFRVPEVHQRDVTLQTRSASSSTISCRVVARTASSQDIEVRVSYHCNPTRTLAHLLHEYGRDEDIAGALRALPPSRFFASVSDAPLSLNGDTNWLSDVDAAQAAFGPDVFDGFLPIYVEQLRRFTAHVLKPSYAAELVEDGDADVLSTDDGELRIEWGRVTAPQAEAYFERYHGSAQAVVRGAAQNVLDRLDQASVRHHLADTSFQRDADMFSMRTKLAHERTLSLYAKAHDRLRFEVSRKGAGRYEGAVQPGPSGRLLQILSSERRALLAACPWQIVGSLFAEHGVPVPGDLVGLVAAIARACADAEHLFQPVLRSLLIDAGISRTATNEALIVALQTSGVISRTPLRRRDTVRLPRRYSLAEPFVAVQRAVLTAVSGNDDTATATG